MISNIGGILIGEEDYDSSNLRRATMTRVCQDINHKYMNGINCIYLNYRRNESEAGT